MMNTSATMGSESHILRPLFLLTFLVLQGCQKLDAQLVGVSQVESYERRPPDAALPRDSNSDFIGVILAVSGADDFIRNDPESTRIIVRPCDSGRGKLASGAYRANEVTLISNRWRSNPNKVVVGVFDRERFTMLKRGNRQLCAWLEHRPPFLPRHVSAPVVID